MTRKKKPNCASPIRYWHDWLPDDEEANVLGFYVPTPEQIAEICQGIQSGEIAISGNHGGPRRSYRVGATPTAVRKAESSSKRQRSTQRARTPEASEVEQSYGHKDVRE